MPSPDYKSMFIEALKKNTDSPKWNEGNFVGIKTVSNTKVGSVGQTFIENLCDTLSIPYNSPVKVNKERLAQSPWDIEIYGVKF